MSRFSLLQKFAAVSLLGLIVFGLAFGRIVVAAMEGNIRSRAASITASCLIGEITKELQAEDLFRPHIGEDFNVFAGKVARLHLCTEVDSIRFWNADGVLVWAKQEKLIGTTLPGNQDLQAALQGKAVPVFRETEETKNAIIQYLPVRFTSQGPVDGVLEVRQQTGPLDHDIHHHNTIIWVSTGLGMFFLFVMFYGLVSSASRRLSVQNKEIIKSEERCRHLFQSAQDGIITLDSNHCILSMNPAAEALFGCTAEEMEGISTEVLFADSFKDFFIKRSAARGQNGQKSRKGEVFEVAGLHRDGFAFPLELSLSQYQGDEESISLAIFRDISKRKLSEQSLHRSEERFRAVFEQSPLSIQVMSPDGQFVAVNPAWEKFWGGTIGDLAGYCILEDPQLVRLGIMPFIQRAFQGEACEIPAAVYDPVESSPSFVHGQKRHVSALVYPSLDGNGEVEEVILVHLDVSEQYEVQYILTRAKREWEETFDAINDAITVHDLEYNVLRINRAAADLLGVKWEQVSKMKCFNLYHDSDTPPPSCHCCDTCKKGNVSVTEVYEPHLGKHLEIKALPRLDGNGKVVGIVHIARDITVRKQAEEEKKKLRDQLLLSQKLESVGRLASGVAHDFNNVLSAIIGYSELIMSEIDEEHPLYESIQTISDSGEKGAVLVRQLLSFSRKQILDAQVVNLNSVVDGMSKILNRIIGEDIVIETVQDPDLANVLADPGQMEQILMNLAVNARDAMPSGGRLLIGTSNIIQDREVHTTGGVLLPGHYVKIELQDTGVGMAPAVVEKIFEPFFTTKAVGKGTGLGLATVYGIVIQHNGSIQVESGPGKGTTFTIYLPVTHERVQAVATKENAAMKACLLGSETLLVVEDDLVVRKLVKDILSPLGYRLLIASGGAEALQVSRECAEDIDLIITDVVMPGMSGRETADALVAERPGAKVVFMSGQSADTILRYGVALPRDNFIQKPLSPRKLARKIRDILEAY